MFFHRKPNDFLNKFWFLVEKLMIFLINFGFFIQKPKKPTKNSTCAHICVRDPKFSRRAAVTGQQRKSASHHVDTSNTNMKNTILWNQRIKPIPFDALNSKTDTAKEPIFERHPKCSQIGNRQALLTNYGCHLPYQTPKSRAGAFTDRIYAKKSHAQN